MKVLVVTDREADRTAIREALMRRAEALGVELEVLEAGDLRTASRRLANFAEGRHGFHAVVVDANTAPDATEQPHGSNATVTALGFVLNWRNFCQLVAIGSDAHQVDQMVGAGCAFGGSAEQPDDLAQSIIDPEREAND